MRKLLILISVVLIFTVSIKKNFGVFSNLKKQANQNSVDTQKEVLSQESKTGEDSETEDDSDSEDLKEESEIIIKPTIKPFPTSAPTSKPTATNLSDFIYQGSSVISSNSNSLKLTSTDNTDTITNWYKEKINSLGMNVKSFVTTSANDKILNKLVGANGTREIRVEISKEPGKTITNIIVESP